MDVPFFIIHYVLTMRYVLVKCIPKCFIADKKRVCVTMLKEMCGLLMIPHCIVTADHLAISIKEEHRRKLTKGVLQDSLIDLLVVVDLIGKEKTILPI